MAEIMLCLTMEEIKGDLEAGARADVQQGTIDSGVSLSLPSLDSSLDLVIPLQHLSKSNTTGSYTTRCQ
jgi:hypothetical protein